MNYHDDTGNILDNIQLKVCILTKITGPSLQGIKGFFFHSLDFDILARDSAELLCMNRFHELIQFRTRAQWPCAWYSAAGTVSDHRFINTRMLALGNPV